MKRISIFSFIVEYFGFLKSIPLAPHVFDSLLRLWTLISNTELLGWIDEIESEVLCWEQTSVSTHKYGGIQFNCKNREIGHLHSNGLLDVLYGRKLKEELMAQGRINAHHVFKESGWISFYIRNYDDVIYAKALLAVAYNKIM